MTPPIKLTHRVMVQQLSTVPDQGGGQARLWSDFREVWANVKWNSVGSSSENGALGQGRRALLTLRWASDLPDPLRLIIGGKTFRFRGSTRLKIGAGEFLQIECEESF